jgi:hypothetical protein
VATIEVASAVDNGKKFNARALLAELCYYYPQYSLAAARRLPAKDVMLLLNTARKKDAERYYNFTQIAAAPHTKKGSGVKSLSKRYRRAMNGK